MLPYEPFKENNNTKTSIKNSFENDIWYMTANKLIDEPIAAIVCF